MSANSRSARSFSVSEGIGSVAPGTLTPLCESTFPPTATLQCARPAFTSSTCRCTSPSSMRTSCPGTRTSASTGGLTGRSPGSPVPSPERTTSSPLASTTVPGRSPMRSFGPWRSAISASGRPARAWASRMRRARSAWSSCEPCEKLRRAASIPESTSLSSISRDEVAGPIVQTILVRRRPSVTPPR